MAAKISRIENECLKQNEQTEAVNPGQVFSRFEFVEAY